MVRDFTYVSDLTNAIYLLRDKIPSLPRNRDKEKIHDSISDVAPYRVVNIGNSKPINLLEFIAELENVLGVKAKKNYLGMQDGDVYKTHSDISLLENLIGRQTKTNVSQGIKRFVDWYKAYYF